MPIISPSDGDLHVNAALTNMSIAYAQDMTSFVADQVFPNIPCDKRSDIYWQWGRAEWNRDDMQERAPGAETPGTGLSLTRLPFYIPVYGVHHPMPDQVVDNADDPAGYDAVATMFVTMKAKIRRETSWVTNYFNYAAWGAGYVGGATRSTTMTYQTGSNTVLYWNNPASTPIEDIRAAMTYTQLRNGGFRPNILTLSRQVADVLFDHPDLTSRVNSGQTPGGPATVNEQTLAAILGLKKVLVMNGIVNISPTGVAEVNQFFGGKNALLSYAPDVVQKMMPSAGYTFSWTGYLGATPDGTRIKRWYNIDTATTKVEAETAYFQGIMGADCGFFFSGIIQ